MNDVKIKQLIHAIKTSPIVCVDDIVSDVMLVGYKLVGESSNYALSLKYTIDLEDISVNITEQGFCDARIEYNHIYCKDYRGVDVLISLHKLIADNTYLSQIE